MTTKLLRKVSRRRAAAPLLAILLLPGAARAEEAPPAYTRGTFAFVLENDSYDTNGFFFAWVSPSGAAPALAPFFPEGGTPRWGLAFGQKKFTPEDTLLRNPALRTGPMQVGDGRAAARRGRAFRARPAGAEHHARHRRHRPGLWLELPDQGPARRQPGAGEAVADQPADQRRVVDRRRRQPRHRADLWQPRGDVPCRRCVRHRFRLAAGASRCRRILFFEPGEKWGWYAFAVLEGRAVGRDIALNDSTWRDSRSVGRKTLVADAGLGAALVVPRARLTATCTIRSKESTTQRKAAQFGSLSLAFRL